jgi:hypothetical protein
MVHTCEFEADAAPRATRPPYGPDGTAAPLSAMSPTMRPEPVCPLFERTTTAAGATNEVVVESLCVQYDTTQAPPGDTVAIGVVCDVPVAPGWRTKVATGFVRDVPR